MDEFEFSIAVFLLLVGSSKASVCVEQGVQGVQGVHTSQQSRWQSNAEKYADLYQLEAISQ